MRRAVFRRLKRARTWALRLLISTLMLTGCMPPSARLEFLRWLREDMHPLHPGMPTVLREIAEAEDSCRA